MSDKELIETLKSYNKEAWDNLNYEEFTEKQRPIVQKEKNKFFNDWYKERPSDEKIENQSQNETSSKTQSNLDRYIAELEAQQAEYMAKENPSFVMYHSFYEALEGIHGEAFEKHMRALCERGLYKKTDNYKGSIKMFMAQAAPQIEANEKRKIKARINGLRGGAPEGNKNALKQPKTT